MTGGDFGACWRRQGARLSSSSTCSNFTSWGKLGENGSAIPGMGDVLSGGDDARSQVCIIFNMNVTVYI